MREVGLISPNRAPVEEEKPRRHRRRRRRRSTHSQSADLAAEGNERHRNEGSKDGHGHRHDGLHNEPRRDSGVER